MRIRALLILLLLGATYGYADATTTILIGHDTNGVEREYQKDGTFIQTWGEIGGATGAAVDEDGNVYINNPSFGNNRIERRSPTGGDLGTITATVDGQWIEDLGNFGGGFILAGTFEGRVYKISTADGSHTLLFSTTDSFLGVTYDGTNIWTTGGLTTRKVYKRTLDGTVLAEFDTVEDNGGIGYDPDDGTLWIGHFNGKVTHSSLTGELLGSFTTGINNFLDGVELRRTAAPPTITTVAGTGTPGFNGDFNPDSTPKAATSAQLNFPRGVAVGGSFYIADRHNHRIRKVDNAGNITTVAGTGVAGFSGDGGPATSAQLNLPYDVALDADGNLYIADFNSQRIRMVAPGTDGVVNGGLGETITTVAGNGIVGGAGDGGLATAANLWNPKGVAVSGGAVSGGTLYIAAEMNQKIRGVDLATGIISTVAGNGLAGFSGDGGPATAFRLNGPNGVDVDGAGNVYVADTGNDRIRKVSAGSIITTVAGTGMAGFSGDGGDATLAQLNRPTGVVVHPTTGDLYIADFSNNRIRKVNAAGTISTAAGTGVACAPSTATCGDGGAATAAQLNGPADVAIDPATGDLYIADLNDHRIRRVGTGE